MHSSNNKALFGSKGRAVRISVLAAGIFAWAAVQAADTKSQSELPGTAGISSSAAGDLGKEVRPVDVEAQLREIENTKKLMKALGELHSQGKASATEQGVKGSDAARPSPAALPQSTPEAVAREGGGLELPRLPGEELRAIAGGVSQAARAVGLETGARPASAEDGLRRGGVDGHPAEATTKPRAYSAGDHERLSELFDKFIDEVLPWFGGIAVLLAICYAIYGAMASRGRLAARSPGRRQDYSRRGRKSRRGGSSRHGSDMATGEAGRVRIPTGK